MPGRHRLRDAEHGGRRERRVGRVAAALEHAQPGARCERLARRHHAVRGNGGRATEGEPVRHQSRAISAAGPSMRVKRGTTESALVRAQ